MVIQACPVELLDKLFEFTAYADPKNAPASLRSLMLTCSYFHPIARRHFIRIVCLPNEEKMNAFAYYLLQVLEGGDYGKGVLPIQHLAVVGGYRWKADNKDWYCSDAVAKAMRVVPVILSIAAPTLLTLTIFGMKSDHRFLFGSIQVARQNWEDNFEEPIFPKLHDLIALEQKVLDLLTVDGESGPDKRACQLSFPSLRRLFIPSLPDSHQVALPSALPYLADLRLDMQSSTIPPPPKKAVDHVRSLIIDAPAPSSSLHQGDRLSRRQAKCNAQCRTLIEEVGTPERNGVVFSAYGPETSAYRDPDCILSAWADAVVGGEACWTTAWVSEWRL